ncbi:MAG: hypothetical protein ACREQ5_25830 [Candidatus Dormibacteria bacterium]
MEDEYYNGKFAFWLSMVLAVSLSPVFDKLLKVLVEFFLWFGSSKPYAAVGKLALQVIQMCVRIFRYTDSNSVNNDSHFDLALGNLHSQVAWNNHSPKNLPVFAIVADTRGWAQVAILTKEIPASDGIWQTKENGKAWKHVFSAILDKAILLPIDLQKILRNDQWTSKEDRQKIFDFLTSNTDATYKYANILSNLRL